MTLAYPKAVLFDWDNTLVDTWGVIHHALEKTFKTMGHRPWTLEETQIKVRASARETFPKLFGGRAEEAMKIFYEAFEAHHIARLKVHEGAEEMLRTLCASDILLGVVSNKLGYLLRREADHLGWTGYFHRLVGANDAARDKPAREAVDLALSDSDLLLGPEIWFVGDTDIDMTCAQETGCQPILLRPDGPKTDEFPTIENLHHVSSCPELTVLVKNSRGAGLLG